MPNLVYLVLLIMRKYSGMTKGITLKAIVLELCPFLTEILSRLMAPDRQALVLYAVLFSYKKLVILFFSQCI